MTLELGRDRAITQVLTLPICKGIKDPAVRMVRPLVLALIVACDPDLKLLEHCVLRLLRGVLVRLPLALLVLRQASFQSGVEENKLRAVAGCGLYKAAVAALNDPTVVLGDARHAACAANQQPLEFPRRATSYTATSTYST